MMSNEDVKAPKPDPEIYLKTFAALRVDPTQALVLEDNEHGLQAARASGAHVMVVETVAAVTYENIMSHIQRVEAA